MNWTNGLKNNIYTLYIMATIGVMIGSGLLVGATFLAGGQILQATEGLIQKGVNFVEHEFANKRKNKDGDNPLTNNDDINDKVTANERAILKELMTPTKK